MNYTRILRLADTIARQADYDRERSPKGFSMKEYDHPCGSPCCIAGWAVSIYHGDKPLGVGQMPPSICGPSSWDHVCFVVRANHAKEPACVV